MSGTASALGSSTLLPATAASLSPNSSSAASSATGSGPGQTDFMKLLMAQMSHQDPSSPTNPTDYVTQMAQFTSVQNLNQLNQSLTSLLALQGLTQGISLIGKTVTYTNAAGKPATGTVASVAMVSGQPQLVVNGANVTLAQIQGIQAGPRTGVTPSGTSAP
jgi:flagellar basal-body rod modification protein FlgD